MTLSRKGIADEFDRLDHEVEAANFDKRAIMAGYRKQLENGGMARAQIKIEMEALRIAIRQRRKLARDRDVVTLTDSRAQEILAEITLSQPAGHSAATPSRARSASRAYAREEKPNAIADRAERMTSAVPPSDGPREAPATPRRDKPSPADNGAGDAYPELPANLDRRKEKPAEAQPQAP
jgi:hypothetical protein